VEVVDEQDVSPFVLAILSGQAEVTNVLLEHGVAWIVNDVKWTPSHRALFEGNIEAIRILIERGADLTGHTDDAPSLLQAASLGGHVEVIQVVLEHGIDVTAKCAILLSLLPPSSLGIPPGHRSRLLPLCCLRL
jgi:ankyrin repeat protein